MPSSYTPASGRAGCPQGDRTTRAPGRRPACGPGSACTARVRIDTCGGPGRCGRGPRGAQGNLDRAEGVDGTLAGAECERGMRERCGENDRGNVQRKAHQSSESRALASRHMTAAPKLLHPVDTRSDTPEAPLRDCWRTRGRRPRPCYSPLVRWIEYDGTAAPVQLHPDRCSHGRTMTGDQSGDRAQWHRPFRVTTGHTMNLSGI